MEHEEKTDERLEKEGVTEGEGSGAVDSGGESPYEAEESWMPIETKMVAGSLVAGMIALIVLAALVHIFLLGGQ